MTRVAAWLLELRIIRVRSSMIRGGCSRPQRRSVMKIDAIVIAWDMSTSMRFWEIFKQGKIK